MPDEMIRASGAIPLGLIRGGDHEPVLASEAYLWRFIDTFCRAQIGYRVRGEPLYQLPDFIVGLATDRNTMAIAEMWQLNTDVETFKYGVPSRRETPQAYDYYLNGLKLLRERLEKLTGNRVTDEKLADEIEYGNRVRTLLEEISAARKQANPPFSGSDFITLNHATYIADKKFLLETLEEVKRELQTVKPEKKKKPRLMLTGSTLACGDNTLVSLLEKGGAAIVIEEFSEGVRHYDEKVVANSDPLVALADRYLRRRAAPAFFKNARVDKFRYLFDLIRAYKVEGVVWYSLLYRDGYDRWAVFFAKALEKEFGIPFLKIISDYDPSEAGTMHTRVDAFLEMLGQR